MGQKGKHTLNAKKILTIRLVSEFSSVFRSQFSKISKKSWMIRHCMKTYLVHILRPLQNFIQEILPISKFYFLKITKILIFFKQYLFFKNSILCNPKNFEFFSVSIFWIIYLWSKFPKVLNFLYPTKVNVS